MNGLPNIRAYICTQSQRAARLRAEVVYCKGIY